MDTLRIADSLRKNAIAVFERIMSAHSERLNRSYTILRDDFSVLSAALASCGKAENAKKHLLTAYLSLINNVREHLDCSENILYPVPAESITDVVRTEVEELIDSLPDVIDRELPREFWKSTPEDTLAVKTARLKCRGGLALRNMYRGTANIFRPLFKKEKLKAAVGRQKYQPGLLAEQRFILPLSQVLLQTEHKILKHAVSRLMDIHTKSAAIFNAASFTGPCDMETHAKYDEYSADMLAFLDSSGPELEIALNEIRVSYADSLESIIGHFIRDYERAGTFLLPADTFGKEIVEKNTGRFAETVKSGMDAWQSIIENEKCDWNNDLALNYFRLNNELIYLESAETFSKNVQGEIISVLDEVGQELSKNMKSFGELSGQSGPETVGTIRQNGTSLAERLQKHALPRMQESVMRADIEGQYKKFLLKISGNFAVVPDEFFMMSDCDIETVPPRSKSTKITLRELLNEELMVPLENSHAQQGKVIADTQESLLRSITEIEQIVDFNVSSALDLLTGHADQDTLAEAVRLINEGLSRTVNQLEEIKERFVSLDDAIDESLNGMVAGISTKVVTLTENEKMLDLRLRHAKARTQREVRERTFRTLKLAKGLILNLFPWLVKNAGRIKQRVLRLLSFIGLHRDIGSTEVRAVQYMTEMHAKFDQLPYVYQRLFDMKPLSDRRFFASRSDEMEAVRSLIEKWKSGERKSFALVGERGSGKTTLLNFIESDFLADVETARMELHAHISGRDSLLAKMKELFPGSEAASLDELAADIESGGVRRAVILENLHFLFLRTVDGFDNAESFILFMQKTREHVLWIVSCALYGWQFMDKVIRIAGYFSDSLNLGLQNREQIAEAILKRHRISGYKCRYREPEKLMSNKKYRKLASEDERQAFLEDMLFGQIAELSRGNMRVAMLFWLSSIRQIQSDGMLVDPEIEFDHTFIYQFGDDDMFTFAALVQHEKLSVEQHALIFHHEIMVSELRLNRLFGKGYLEKKDGNFYIHPFLYRPVVKALQSKNILH